MRYYSFRVYSQSKEGDKEQESTTMAARVEAIFDRIENFKDILKSNINRRRRELVDTFCFQIG